MEDCCRCHVSREALDQGCRSLVACTSIVPLYVMRWEPVSIRLFRRAGVSEVTRNVTLEILGRIRLVMS